MTKVVFKSTSTLMNKVTKLQDVPKTLFHNFPHPRKSDLTPLTPYHWQPCVSHFRYSKNRITLNNFLHSFPMQQNFQTQSLNGTESDKRAKSIFVNKENSEQALGHLFIKSSSSHFFNRAISNTTSNYNPIFSLNLNPAFIEFRAKTSFFSTLPVKNLVERLSFLEYFCH